MMTQQRNVAILIFDEVEVLDFCGPFEVFSVTQGSEGKPFNVYTVAEKSPISARNNLSVNPTYLLENCPTPDILVVPGGWGTRKEMNNPIIVDWVKNQFAQLELMLSVCTGSLILGKAGLLDGLSATTHHGAFDTLRTAAPNTQVCEGERYVDNGKIVTSGGISAGIDMAFHFVSRLLGEDTAVATAKYMEFDWTPEKPVSQPYY
jgi:transcriptional regulator GlxA family with amidase domain